jgi:putative ABC transport system permease protein
VDSFFGVSTTRLALGALALVLAALLILAIRAYRWPIFLRLGVRQLPRRPAQTALVVAGLMLSTALVAASLSTGDTITHSLRTAAVGELGRLDEIVTYSALTRPTGQPPTVPVPQTDAAPPAGPPNQPNQPGPPAPADVPFTTRSFFPLDVYDRLRDQLRSNPTLARDVEGASPAIWLDCTLVDHTTHQTANGAIRALPADYNPVFGELSDAAGHRLSFGDLQPGDLLLNDAGGASLAAQPGDEVTCVTAGVPLRWQVRATLAPRGLGAGTISGGWVALPHLQAALGTAGTGGVPNGINQIWLSNRGGLVGGADRTDRVSTTVRPLLADDAALRDLATLLARPDYRAALALRRASLNDRTQRAIADLLTLVDEGDRPIARSSAPPPPRFPGEPDDRPSPNDPFPRRLERALRNGGLRQPLLAAARDLPDPAVAESVENALARATGFQLQPIKRQLLGFADRAGNVITTIFLLFSLLSIAAGLLLIFLIFSLLAASRRSELGIARALGTERSHLVAMFTFEGAAYALLAAAIGVPVGLAISRVLVATLVWAVQSGAYGFTGAGARIAETVQWTAAPRSIALAAALGLLLTIATVAIAAWRVSRVTIVTAIRDLPEPPPIRGAPTPWRARWWWLFLPAGIALVVLGLRIGQTFPFAAGISLLLLFAGMLTRFLAARRWSHGAATRLGVTVAGASLAVYWSLPFDAQQWVGLPRLASGIEIFALAGIVMVAGAVAALAANGDLAQRGLTAALTTLRRPAPTLRLAAAHSLRNPFGTGLTATMFAMVVFMLAVMQVITTAAITFHSDPYTAYGGFDVSALAAAPTATAAPTPVAEPTAQTAQTAQTARTEAIVRAATTLPDLQPYVAGAGSRTTGFFALLQLSAPSPGWGGYNVSAVDPPFAAANAIPLQTRARTFATDRDAWQAVATRDDLAIIDSDALPSPELRGRQSITAFSFTIHGIRDDQTQMDPIAIWVGNPTGGGAAKKVNVVGIVDRRSASAFRALFISATLFRSLGPPIRPPTTRYYFRLQPGADVNTARAALGDAFFEDGLQTTDLNTQFQNESGPLLLASKLLQFFVGLGLFVGIAALGVISSRAALERRQEIGILRTIGYGRWQVGGSLLIESALVVFLGSGVGVSLALILCRNVFAVQFFDRFQQGMRLVIPWDQLLFTVATTCVVALAATWLPARHASRIPPMAALRGD